MSNSNFVSPKIVSKCMVNPYKKRPLSADGSVADNQNSTHKKSNHGDNMKTSIKANQVLNTGTSMRFRRFLQVELSPELSKNVKLEYRIAPNGVFLV